MFEYVLMFLLGIFIIALGIINYKGNINSIHFYNRKKITEETRIPHGKLMGTGTAIIGLGLIATAILEMFVELENLYYVSLPCFRHCNNDLCSNKI
ncbi:MAG: hypothetical protein J1F32_06270 [Erysipelotrichales bacterium]|nr:hypothetical protein [Erysipelotrichales bacterium]